MVRQVVRRLLWSQIALFGGLGACFGLIPKFLTEHNEGGVSNYGVHARTIVPYSLAFGLSAGFVLAAARLIKPATKAWRQLRYIFYIYAGLLLLVLITTYPYKLNDGFKNLHVLSAILIFVFEMAASVWLALVIQRDAVTGWLLAGQLFGFGLGGLTFFGAIHRLFIAQIVTSLTFGLLLLQAARRQTAQDRAG